MSEISPSYLTPELASVLETMKALLRKHELNGLIILAGSRNSAGWFELSPKITCFSPNDGKSKHKIDEANLRKLGPVNGPKMIQSTFGSLNAMTQMARHYADQIEVLHAQGTRTLKIATQCVLRGLPNTGEPTSTVLPDEAQRAANPAYFQELQHEVYYMSLAHFQVPPALVDELTELLDGQVKLNDESVMSAFKRAEGTLRAYLSSVSYIMTRDQLNGVMFDLPGNPQPGRDRV